MSKKILLVDDEPNNLQMLRQILRERYHLLFAPNGAKAIEAAASHLPDLILLDIMMPGMSGYEVCERLKAMPATRDIPLIFVTAMSEVEDEARGFDAGAVDYIQKPVSAAILLRRIETHLSLVRVAELEKTQRQAIFMLGDAGHYNDTDIGVHIWRMAAYAGALAAAAEWPEALVQRLELAAPMHDMGKIGVPNEILRAPRKLTDKEWAVMKRHTEIGAHILGNADSPIFVMAAEIARSHHEKWDGSGYPDGLSGAAIPESARIVAVADVFDALTMKRPYKHAWSVDQSIDQIRQNAGTHFEPRLVGLLDKVFPQLLHIKAVWEGKEEQVAA